MTPTETLERRDTAVTTAPQRAGTGTLILLASIVVSFLAASSAPTPLYATYAASWHFSPITTTVIFGVYAIAVLLALLLLGRLSDHVGRRPVLLTALTLQVAAMTLFITADGIGALLVGRVLQGIATGGALGTLGAAMIDVHRTRGTLANSTAPALGTGLGALTSGLVVQFLPAPTRMIYALLIVAFAAQAVGVWRIPESRARGNGLRKALTPQVGVPRHLRAHVLTAIPALFAVWSLGGFYGSLAPALVRHMSGSDSAVFGGLGLFVLAVAGAVATVLFDRTPPRTVMMSGIGLLTVGAAGTLAAIGLDSVAAFFAGTLVAGAGFGAAFQGALRTVVPLAEPHERTGLLSVLYIVSYLGMGLPAVVAGVLVVHGGGLLWTARGYSLFVIVLAGAALAGLIGNGRRTR
ncbi:MFS transporter [Catenuloplanes japonicus]|uniref:MFS transporter n=1 Tax=Catenuloplanes japonicus TaxID=33876 RepID=UPI00068BA9A0|nr:MFS transporter [Catenuloplanes japonicus]